jgi:hypothetical protein
MLFLGTVSAANAADGVPDPAATPVVATADPSPSPDSAPVAAPAADPAPAAPSSTAPVVADTDAPGAPTEKSSPPPPAIQPAPQVAARIANNGNETPKKVFVCKYVGTPGVDERPQTGQNPISVSVSAIQHNEWDGTVPGYFSDAHDRSYVLAYDTGQTKPDVSACPTPVGPPPVVQKEVGLYIYPLLDATQAPSWENSGTQIFCKSKDGDTWFTTVSCTLPPQVCGASWGYQQDKVKDWGYAGAFNWPSSIQYPTDNIGWPPIYDAKHGLLSELTTVPDCTPPPPTDVCKNIAGDQATVPANFVQDGENCVPVPAVCTASTVDATTWSTEDGAPTVGYEGADFSTPNVADKVNYFGRTLNVPFAGVTGGSYTVKNTGGPIAAYDFEVWQTGSAAFATIVFEPYVNGLTGTGTSGDGAFHTYVITGSSLVWNSKITSGEGSQAQPVTLTRMQELIPAATLIRAGLGQGKNNAGSLSTVSSFTDPACGYTVFPTKPAPVAPSATVTHVCTADGPNLTFHLAAGTSDTTFQFLINGVQVEEHTVLAGEEYTGDISLGEDSFGGSATVEVTSGEVSLTGELVVSTDCNTPGVVHPENVWFNDSCGVSDDSINAPGSQVGDAVTYRDSETGDVTTSTENESELGGYFVNDKMSSANVRSAQVLFLPYGDVTIAEPGPDDTYTIVTIDGIKYAQWTYTFDSTPCPLTVIATPPAPVVNPATCTADGSLPPLTDGESYTAAYNRAFNGPGAYTVVYTANAGTTFKDGSTVSYDLTVASKLTSGCTTTTSNGGPSSLAFTGADVAGGVSLAIALLFAGLLMINPTRRRIFGFVRRIAGQTGRHIQA